MLRTSVEKNYCNISASDGLLLVTFESIEIAHGKLVILHKVETCLFVSVQFNFFSLTEAHIEIFRRDKLTKHLYASWTLRNVVRRIDEK